MWLAVMFDVVGCDWLSAELPEEVSMFVNDHLGFGWMQDTRWRAGDETSVQRDDTVGCLPQSEIDLQGNGSQGMNRPANLLLYQPVHMYIGLHRELFIIKSYSWHHPLCIYDTCESCYGRNSLENIGDQKLFYMLHRPKTAAVTYEGGYTEEMNV